ncbi:MAG: uroporphyrinogen decarboxylase family protein [Bacteroidales bacterium]
MNSRERTLAAIHHQQPDRPPLYVSLTPQLAEKLSNLMGLPYEPPIDAMESSRISHMGLLTGMGVDLVAIAPTAPPSAPTITLPDGRERNEWGMVFREMGIYSELDEFPLSGALTKADILNYPFPDPLAAGRFDIAKEMLATYGHSHGIIGNVETMFFEISWYLTGYEKFLMDLITEAEYLPHLMDRIMHYIIGAGKKLLSMGIDILWCGDDFGGQNGMLIDPETWRQIIKPRIRYMFEEFRKVQPDIKLAWHSCGSILPIIPDFIELGLDILNPIQPLAKGMDPESLKKNYGKDLVFFGGIDVQELLPWGSPAGIYDEVRRRIDILGRNGGYIVAPAHNIQPDTPVENVMAFFKAVLDP